ncbi:M48 family metalloprotease [Streptomyces sp. SID3212]|nr:M48 family metallopeptidase [Streptomyces sp. SID3212]MYV53280.1 M48 family metalloprotease [Streptomyces sp. SID3212]
MPVNRGFVTWCATCDWNVDPGAPAPAAGRVDALRRRLARRHGRWLADEMARGESLRPHRDASSVLAYVIALAVHAGIVMLTALGAVLIVAGWDTVVQPMLGIGFLLLAVTVRPRVGRLPEEVPVLTRDDAPRLFALVDEVAAVVGTTGVHRVVVLPDANASVGTYGVRGRRVLYLGLGLWEILTPAQRVALLGHELGHYAHGDTRHSKVVGTALRTLAFLVDVLTPDAPHGFLARIGAVMLLTLRAAVLGVLVLLDHLTLRASQRAEYLADAAAGRVASPSAVVELMDLLLVSDTVRDKLRRESVRAHTGIGGQRPRDAEQGLWERLAAQTGAVPPEEYERLRRAGERRGHSADSTHPPTHLRRRHMAEAEPRGARVTCDDTAAQAIAAELAPARASTARHVIRDYAG